MTPAKQILELAKAITLDVYNKKQLQRDSQAISLQNEREHLEKQIKAATDRLIATTSPVVQAALEKQIEDFESQRHHLELSLRKMSTNIDFGTALQVVMKFIGNPHDTWVSGDLNQKRLVQKLVFRRPVVIDPSQAIGTADLSLPFKMLKEFSDQKTQLWRESNLLCNLLIIINYINVAFRYTPKNTPI